NSATRRKSSKHGCKSAQSNSGGEIMRARDLFRWRWLVSSILLVSAIAGIAQTPPTFVYVFPKFSADSSAELILSNLSQRLVTADISFYDPTGGGSTGYPEVAAKGQMRATASDFVAQGARNFDGTVVVRASGPLSAQAKVP